MIDLRDIKHCRGFAVVADEVRKLAKKSQQSTTSIGLIISRIQDDSKKMVTNVQSFMEKSEIIVNISDVVETRFNIVFEQMNTLKESAQKFKI
ncbi:MAG: hypothetical protein GQ474_08200 [Sulfurimonas sp.]|nr:hypothetical protein [Sulfurimonas sp.]